MPARGHKSEIIYRRLRRHRSHSSICAFCALKQESKKEEIIKEYKHFYLIKNLFPYDIWDDQGVLDHIMLTPKRHIETIGDLGDDELIEYAKIIGKYEKKGYSVYARSHMNSIKSIPHQHTHFIKLDGKELSFLFYKKHPHVLFKK